MRPLGTNMGPVGTQCMGLLGFNIGCVEITMGPLGTNMVSVWFNMGPIDD